MIKKNWYKEFDSELAYSEKYLQAKIKSYNRKISTDFHNNEISKEASQFICWSIILINSIFRTGKNYSPRVFVEENKMLSSKK